MRVVFRVDSSIQIGTGHVMRCLTLADRLKAIGAQCLFVCRDHAGNAENLIIDRGHRVSLLPEPVVTDCGVSTCGLQDYASWIGAPWQEDAVQTKQIVDDFSSDWIVVDHYGLDARWEEWVSAGTTQVLVIDDLINRHHSCALLLDQNVVGNSALDSYRTLTSESCELLLGPQFALLRPEYAQFANALPARDGTVNRVLVFVGGSDPFHLTEQYLRVLSKPCFEDLFVDVVVGANHPNPKLVENVADKRGRVRLYSGLPNLAGLMMRADFMLGAGGSTNWERFCLGLPAVVVGVAQNQIEINTQLNHLGLLCFLGSAEEVTDQTIEREFAAQLEDAVVLANQSKQMSRLVDGLGAEKVADKMIEATS